VAGLGSSCQDSYTEDVMSVLEAGPESVIVVLLRNLDGICLSEPLCHCRIFCLLFFKCWYNRGTGLIFLLNKFVHLCYSFPFLF
jgi:hypothetical protein